MAPQHGDVGGSEGNESRNVAKKRAPSRDVLASLQEKVTRLEGSTTEARVVLDMLESVDLERLGSIDLDKLDSLDSIKEKVQDSLNELDARTADHGDSLEAIVVALRNEVEELKSEGSDFEVAKLKREVELLKTELLVCKDAFENSTATVAPKALGDIPKLEKFKGSRSAQDVENFLWGLDQYFAATGITEDAKKVNIASVYVSEVALMWWRRRCNDVKCGTTAIATWEEFQAEFKEQFYTKYAEDEARSKLRDKASRSDKDSSGSGRNKLSAIKEKDGEGSKTLKLDSILNTMEVKKGRKKKGLMLMDVNVAGQKLSALVDTGASELFMSEPVAKRLGLHVQKVNGSIKTVNAEEVPIARDQCFPGTLCRLLVHLGSKATMHSSVSRGSGVGSKVLFAFQFSKAVRKEEPTFLAILVCDEPATTKDVLDVVSHVLAEFKDVMPAKLPKKLPPKGEVYHQIGLVPNTEPPARAPYRMAPPELEEMHRQLKDLLDTAHGEEQVSNSPHCELVRSAWWCKVAHQVDLQSGYYQVRIAKEDEPKKACVTRYEEKCSFAQTEVPFLGRIVGGGKIWMERDKIRAIEEWKVPTKVTELRSFLGFANYYWHFVKGYSKITAPLTELLKKDTRWDWSPKCQTAFDELKLAMISEPVLVLPDHTKSFEVFTDASDVAIGDVLMQEGHPVAYERWKLNETERRYMVHEKEMTAVVYCLRTWRHYLLGSKFIVFTDNVANTQIRESKFRSRCLKLKVRHGVRQYADGTDVGTYQGGWEGHPGIHQNLALIAKHYYWPYMGNDVEAYVKTCLVCQQDKIEQKKPVGLLQPFPIPERPWESLSMDFIVGLPVTDGFSSIMVVIDRFSKYGTFIPTSKVCPAKEAARLFLKHVVKYWGVPKTIISDRDTRFTGRFWKRLFKLMGSSLNFSTSVHPQTDVQTERVNALVETYLRHYAGKRTKKWADRKRRNVNFEVSDLVLSKLSGILRNPYHKGLVRSYEGPFKVVKRVGTMAYRLELPPTIKAHPVFHVSLLKPYHQDKEEVDQGKSHRAPVGVKVSYEKEVEAIHEERVVHRVGHRPRNEYLVQWKGLSESEGSWEPSEDLWQFRDKIDQFHSSRATRASLELVGENVTDRQPMTELNSFQAARDYLYHVLGLIEVPSELTQSILET
ncbi:hypothetical protein F3Y22_tig00110029pilonHSYRG00062 [Hibiscus syriacus]|uniref:Uncharacterized protein n=1 Tax=Hibiscus syriacus TaxID=106335 RepID=A0A6A3BRN4_HIBSY|nr:hypothetical protein F3Y22_tig00110029pilonHSYRG00062 [Hibiscus syriacus]